MNQNKMDTHNYLCAYADGLRKEGLSSEVKSSVTTKALAQGRQLEMAAHDFFICRRAERWQW